MLKRWVTRFELPEFTEVHAVVERHRSAQCVFFLTKPICMMSFNRTVLGCCCLIKKKKCSATRE